MPPKPASPEEVLALADTAEPAAPDAPPEKTIEEPPEAKTYTEAEVQEILAAKEAEFEAQSAVDKEQTAQALATAGHMHPFPPWGDGGEFLCDCGHRFQRLRGVWRDTVERDANGGEWPADYLTIG